MRYAIVVLVFGGCVGDRFHETCAAPPISTLAHRRIDAYQQFAREVTTRDGSPDTPPKDSSDRKYFDPGRQYFYVPPAMSGFAVEPGVEESPTEPANPRHAKQAARLFALAREALREKEGPLAYQLAHEVLQFDPKHEDARRWVGLTPGSGAAKSAVEVRKSRRAHPRFRWRAGQHVQIATPHFQIATNDETSTALALARTLEEVHSVWRQLFFDCWSSSGALRARDSGQVGRRHRARHRVVMFAKRQEYVKFIRTLEPQAELTRGYYHAPSRTAFFVGGDHPVTSTWRHEVTHQLFHENRATARRVGGEHNFWIVEGAALYMESMQRCRQWLTVGGLEADRLQFARFRALREGFYVPLQSLVAMNQMALQSDERIRSIYSQAAGLTHFLMDGNGGRFRPALMRYLRQVYRDRDSLDLLSEETKTSWRDLDTQYHQFLRVDDLQLRQVDADARIQQLCLGGTAVSDDGFLSLPSLSNAVWIDLYGTQITDRGAVALSEARDLEQLNLERTSVSDATVARLGQAVKLKQLDLSGTRITDIAMTTIGELVKLESLWLANTVVTDEGLHHLIGLKQLQVLDLSGTRSTHKGRAELGSALPRWRAE